MDFNLQKILKALLFSTSEPLGIRDVQSVITRFHQQADEAKDAQEEGEQGEENGKQAVLEDVLSQVPSLLTATQIREALESVAAELEESQEVYRLTEGPGGYRLVVAPEYADWVRLLRGEARPQRLSAAAMETLAIVAYRQPVTRAEIEAVRGVSADSALARLLDHELVQVLGRAELPGRPLQYGTTDRFLEFCGVRSLEELPASDVLSPNQISEWIRKATAPEPEPQDRDVGLPSEDSA